MIKQYVNGKSVGTANASMSSADFTILSSILAGRSENWTLSGSGGTAVSGINPNYKKFSVGKVTINGRKSTAVSLPHVKPAKSIDDIRTAVVGQFDVDYILTEKAEYCNGIGDSSKS